MELTKEEKINIINEHIKNIVINIYNLNILLIQEQSVSPNNQDSIDSLNLQISSAFAKKVALESEKEKLANE